MEFENNPFWLIFLCPSTQQRLNIQQVETECVKIPKVASMMKSMCLVDVEDGLCMALHTLSGQTIQVDWGSEQGYRMAVAGVERRWYHFYDVGTFILSHLHKDHYNGLLYTSTNPGSWPPFYIKEALFPRIPEFKEKAEFLRDLFTMNLLTFGNETGIMEYDFLRAIRRINHGLKPRKRPLSRGDVININSSVFEVVWPPFTLDNERIQTDVKRALKDFNKALEKDELTKRLYDRVSEEGVFEEYLKEEGDEKRTEVRYDKSEIRKQEYRRELPAVVIKANKSLKRAANHLSLAFFEDNRFLFLGDTQSYEISQIIDYLDSRGRKNFYVIVTPHHGTVWAPRLQEIKATYSLSSNGSKLLSKFKLGFRSISKISLATHVNGDIEIPLLPPTVFGWKFA